MCRSSIIEPLPALCGILSPEGKIRTRFRLGLLKAGAQTTLLAVSAGLAAGNTAIHIPPPQKGYEGQEKVKRCGEQIDKGCRIL